MISESILTDDWYFNLTDPQRLAWLHFLILAKRNRGVVGKCSPKTLAHAILVSENAASEMVESALKNGKIFPDKAGDWAVKNWAKYQSDPTNRERQDRHRENVSNGKHRYAPLRNANNAERNGDRTEIERRAEQSARPRNANPPTVSKSISPPNPDLAKQAAAAIAKFKPSENGHEPDHTDVDLAPLFEAYDAMREENSVLHPIDLTPRQRDALADAIAGTKVDDRSLTVAEVITQLRASKFLMGKRAGNFGLHWLTKPANILALMGGDWEQDFDEREQKPEWVDPATQHEWEYRNGTLTKVPKRDHMGRCLLCEKIGDECQCEPL